MVVDIIIIIIIMGVLVVEEVVVRRRIRWGETGLLLLGNSTGMGHHPRSITTEVEVVVGITGQGGRTGMI